MDSPGPTEQRAASDELEAWLSGDGEKTLAGLIDAFGTNSFSLLFVLLLGVSALPLPTGGATHVFEIIAVLLAVQLIANREEIWLPQRWGKLALAGGKREKFLTGLMRFIRRLERVSRPRGRRLFGHRLSGAVYGILVIIGTVGAFVSPPFSGLDTLPSLGVVLVALGVLLTDILVVIVGVLCIAGGIVLEIVLGSAAIHGVSSLL